MTTKQALLEVLSQLREDELRRVLEFARFLGARSERADWRDVALASLGAAYGDDEPEYTEADVTAARSSRSSRGSRHE